MNWVHYFSDFVFTTTRDGELGYDITSHMREQLWGTDTVTGILTDLQNYISRITELLEYLEANLPRVAFEGQ